jgi:hypothetical protein
LLASQSTDFKDGIIFCEILKHLKGSSIFPVVEEIYPPTAETSLKNISIALTRLKSCEFITIPKWIKQLRAEEIYNSEEVMYKFLNFLKQHFQPEEIKQADLKESTAKFPPIESKTINKKPLKKSIDEKEMQINFLQGISMNFDNFYIFPLSTHVISILDKPQSEYPIKTLKTNKTPERNHLNKLMQEISLEQRHKLLYWLESIQLIKHNATTIAEFPSYCRNGVLLSDLIVRLEGVSSKFISSVLINLEGLIERQRQVSIS